MQPYLRASFGGHLELVNHNPHNIKIQTGSFESIAKNLQSSQELIEEGDRLLKQEEFLTALKYFRVAMEKISDSFQNSTKLDEGEEIELLKNMAMCYYNLQLYEDAIEFSNLALDVD